MNGTADASARTGAQPEPGASPLTEKAWNRLRHNGKLLRDEVTGALPPMLRPLAWEQFKQMPMARVAGSLMLLLEPPETAAGLYRHRTRRPAGSSPFDDIPSLSQRLRAEMKYSELCKRHAERLSACPWLRPILAGRARDLALRPDAHGSERGRRMRRIKGGKHVQRRYREQGWHPLASVRKAWGLTGEHPRT
jgi:hypothetical protein